MHLLWEAALRISFTVIVPEGRPEGSGVRMAQQLASRSIPVQIVLDSAVAHVMERVDMVLVGADAVVENGGIIAQVPIPSCYSNTSFRWFSGLGSLSASAHLPWYGTTDVGGHVPSGAGGLIAQQALLRRR